MMEPDPIFDAVIAGAEDGYLVIASRTEPGGAIQAQSFHVREAEAALASARALSATRHVYVESALQRTPPAMGRRGNEQGVAQFSVVTLDFDGAWGLHAQQDLPQEPRDLRRLLDATEAPEPEVVLDTGGGLLAVWTVEALALNTPDDVRRAKALSTGFQRKLRSVAQERFGWKLDSTADLCRLIRLPETLNHKFCPPRSVAVCHV